MCPWSSFLGNCAGIRPCLSLRTPLSHSEGLSQSYQASPVAKLSVAWAHGTQALTLSFHTSCRRASSQRWQRRPRHDRALSARSGSGDRPAGVREMGQADLPWPPLRAGPHEETWRPLPVGVCAWPWVSFSAGEHFSLEKQSVEEAWRWNDAFTISFLKGAWNCVFFSGGCWVEGSRAKCINDGVGVTSNYLGKCISLEGGLLPL